ncbi:hypothetical protein [Bacillus xiapuensis]|uniref:Phage protein n=1 Tax=Bacillus xiapuensis TaxID=2014075 RepID=A0ABU6NB56_9BACI|nr:hypothetical protein [Bacillus xiapuensis]
MKLYEVTNGYIGDSYLRIIVAADDDRARELASNEFKENARNKSYEKDLETRKRLRLDTSSVKEFNYLDNYWTDLEVVCLSEDVSKEYVGEVDE